MIGSLFMVPKQDALTVLRDPTGIHDLLERLYGTSSHVSLEKSWHGLHFVLTGTAWDGQPPLNFLVTGGKPIGEEDVGYGPARLLDLTAVSTLAAALTSFTDAQFEKRFDLAALEREEIYPRIWDEPRDDLLSEYGGYFQDLKAFVARAAKANQALIIAIQ